MVVDLALEGSWVDVLLKSVQHDSEQFKKCLVLSFLVMSVSKPLHVKVSKLHLNRKTNFRLRLIFSKVLRNQICKLLKSLERRI